MLIDEYAFPNSGSTASTSNYFYDINTKEKTDIPKEWKEKLSGEEGLSIACSYENGFTSIVQKNGKTVVYFIEGNDIVKEYTLPENLETSSYYTFDKNILLRNSKTATYYVLNKNLEEPEEAFYVSGNLVYIGFTLKKYSDNYVLSTSSYKDDFRTSIFIDLKTQKVLGSTHYYFPIYWKTIPTESGILVIPNNESASQQYDQFPYLLLDWDGNIVAYYQRTSMSNPLNIHVNSDNSIVAYDETSFNSNVIQKYILTSMSKSDIPQETLDTIKSFRSSK